MTLSCRLFVHLTSYEETYLSMIPKTTKVYRVPNAVIVANKVRSAQYLKPMLSFHIFTQLITLTCNFSYHAITYHDPENGDPSSASAGGDVDEMTLAQKRSRRVSFAETTAVHVFDRDEDFETPPDSKPNQNEEPFSSLLKFSSGNEEEEEESGFQPEHSDSEEDDDDVQERFIRDMDSSSPGSVAGSVTSNDDDNFFGPVSTSFIKAGRLSEAGMSDDNHDITLDSTAFSLHFQNVVPPDDHSANSAGSFMTPTGDSVSSDSHKFPISHGLKNHGLHETGSGMDDTNNMSLIVETQDSYGRYGKLSPTLDALLAEVNGSLESNSPDGGSEINKSTHSNLQASDQVANMPSVAVIHEKIQFNSNCKDEMIQSIGLAENGQNNTLSPPYRRPLNDLVLQSDQDLQKSVQAQLQVPLLLADVQRHSLSENGIQTPQNDLQTPQSPLVGSISSLQSKRRQLLLDPSVLSQTKLMQTPDKEEPLSLKMKLIQHDERISAFKIPKSQKSPIISGFVLASSEKNRMLPEQNCHDGYYASQVSVPSGEKEKFATIAKENVKKNTTISPVQLSQYDTNQNNTCLAFNSSSERANEQKECSQTVDATHDTKASPIQMLGSKLCRYEGGYISPKVDGIANQNNLSDKQSPKNLGTNDGFVCQNKEQIKGPMNFQSGVRDENILANKCMENVVEKTSSSNHFLESTSELHVAVNLSTQLAEKTVQNFSTGSCSDKIMQHLPSNLVQDITAPNKGPNYQDVPSVQKSSGKKRGIVQMLPTIKDNLNEERRIQKIPQIIPDAVTTISNSITAYDVECSDESMNVGDQTPQKHWKDIFANVAQSTREPFSPFLSRLNSEELDNLEDILDEFQIARKYKRLCTSLTKQRFAGEHQEKRVAEARALVDKLLYEKAKLQLKKVKLDRLLSKVQMCKAEVQECAKMKSVYSQLRINDMKITKNCESQFHRDSNDSNTSDEIEYNRVISMRQEIDKLDQKVKNLMKTFESSCKIKATMSCSEMIKVVNNHIEMKENCRLIKQNLQLWKLSHVVSSTDRCEIVLNYCDLLYQRFIVHCRSVTSIVATILKKDDIIEKNFPNMNACVAFEFLFKFSEDHRLACSDLLSQETMETNLLLGNLLDILEEIMISRLQSWNLVSSSFLLQRLGQLDLELSFLSFKSCQRVTLLLDLTFLNCGVYPSKQSDLNIRILEAKTTFPQSNLNEIMAAIECVESRRSIIVTLCQIVTKVVQDLDGS